MKLLKKHLPTILITILPFIFFYQVFIGQSIFVGDFTGSDMLDLHLPFRFALQRALQERSLPLWINDISMGYPLLAEGQTGILYPPVLLLGLIDPILSLNLNIVFVFLLTSLTSLYYFRLKNLSKVASLYASIAFAYSAFFITRIKHVNLINTASLFPLLLIIFEKYLKKPKVTHIILSSLVICLMFFAGHPQIAFYNILIIIFYCFYYSQKKLGQFSSAITFLSFTIVLGTLFAAVQILPTIELLNLSTRTQFSTSALTNYPFHPINLINIFLPYYFGNPANATYSLNIQKYGIFWENANYAGILTAALAVVSIFQKRFKKNPDVKFFTILGVVCLALMLGPFTPLFQLLAKNIPLFSSFRFPTRFNLYFIFAICYLAAEKLDSILASSKKRIVLSFGAIAFLVMDLLVFSTDYLAFIPKDALIKKSALIESIQEKESDSPYRIYNITQHFDSPYAGLGWKKGTDEILALRHNLPPNNNIIFSIDYFNDRTWFEGGLSIKEKSQLENFILQKNEDRALTGKLLGMYNTKYILTFSDYLGFEIEQIDSDPLTDSFSTPLKLFENYQFMPRVYFVPEATVVNSNDKALEKIKDPNFLPTKTVILHDAPEKIPPPLIEMLTQFQKDNTVKTISYTNKKIEIETDLKDHGFLVISKTHYPGWIATVDNNPQKILKANYAVDAIELNPGTHKVVLEFKSKSFLTGAIISLSSISLTIIFAISFNTITKVKKIKKEKSKKPKKDK